MSDSSLKFGRHEPAPTSRRSLSDVFGDLSREFDQLIQQELQTAKRDLQASAPIGGRSRQLLGAAAVAAFLAMLFVSLAAAWGLGQLIPLGWAFLAVGAAFGVATAVLLRERRDVDIPS